MDGATSAFFREKSGYTPTCAAWSGSCSAKSSTHQGDTLMTPLPISVDCGHEVLARGLRSGFTTFPGKAGTLCYPCADDLHRLTMANPHVRSYRARLNGTAITSPYGGRLAEVVLRTASREFVRPSETLWITDTGGRTWVSHVSPGRQRGSVILTYASKAQIPTVRPSADTVLPNDTVEAWGTAYTVVKVSSVGATIISPATSGRGTTQFVHWAAVSRHTPQSCCIGPRDLCRCVNGVPECPMSGCNGRATTVVDRHEYHGARHTVTWEERVCPEHYERLITLLGWSTPARGVAE
ncbi:hypothetical protein H4W33_006457 [Kibdelosporangium phytohabitans]|nr:hypothetical protein [Kibdelosporangium phytohabitans]